MKSERALKTALIRFRAVFLEGAALRVVDEGWPEPGDVVSGDDLIRRGGTRGACYRRGRFRASSPFLRGVGAHLQGLHPGAFQGVPARSSSPAPGGIE